MYKMIISDFRSQSRSRLRTASDIRNPTPPKKLRPRNPWLLYVFHITLTYKLSIAMDTIFKIQVRKLLTL